MGTMILVALVVVGLVGLYDELLVSRHMRGKQKRPVRVESRQNEQPITMHLADWHDDREHSNR